MSPNRPVGTAPLRALGELLRRCEFPDPLDGAVTLAVSGGPDSLALVVLAKEAGLSGTAIHVDHGLREGSAAESDVVERAATRFGFGFERVWVDVTAGADLEARARRARYEVLPTGVLTGHTLDDQAETVLLNLLRGAGLDGLAGMRKGPWVRVGRPMLRLRRSDTEWICRTWRLEPVLDESNADLRFRRNRVRHQVLPLLDEVSGRDVRSVLARQAALLGEEAALLDLLAAQVDVTDAGALSRAPLPLARRAVRTWLRSSESGGDLELHPPSLAEVERVLAVASGDAKACQVSGGRRVQRRRGRLASACPVQRHQTGTAKVRPMIEPGRAPQPASIPISAIWSSPRRTCAAG